MDGIWDMPYWQLGIEKEEDRNNLDSYYKTPVKIAENVIHIDASDNRYFTVYLTEDHKLYGLGANTEGVLLQPLQEFEELNYHKNITGIPVLLMENVQFVSAGRKSLTVLTDDGNVFWWGKFQSTTASQEISCMSSTSPELMVSQAIYTACGPNFAYLMERLLIIETVQMILWKCYRRIKSKLIFNAAGSMILSQ